MAESSKKKDKGPKGEILFPLIPLPESRDSWGTDPSLVIHNGIVCDGPLCRGLDRQILGIRYKCERCPKCDFCDECIRHPDNSHNRTHKFFECLGQSEFLDPNVMSTADIEEAEQFSEGAPLEYIHLSGDPVQQNGILRNSNGRAAFQRIGRPVECHETVDPAKYWDQPSVRPEQLILHSQDHMDDATMHPITRYAHSDQPLPEGKAAIRLFHLQPGGPEDKLQGSFTSTQLEDPFPYEAVSCSWETASYTPERASGDDTSSVTQRGNVVYIGDSHYLGISPKLGNALRQLRHVDEVRTLWSEELCIDLGAELERNHQIRATGLIFSRATTAIVWAGEEYEHTQAVFELIELLAYRCKCAEEQLPTPEDIDNDPELGLSPVGSEEWQSLVRFFPQHVLRHGWKFHDVTFAKDAVVKCGEYQHEWWKVDRIATLLRQEIWVNVPWRRNLDISRLCEAVAAVPIGTDR